MESGVKDFIFISGRDTSENVDPGDDKGGDKDVKGGGEYNIEGEGVEEYLEDKEDGVEEYLEDKEDGVEEYLEDKAGEDSLEDKAGEDSLEMRAESVGNEGGEYDEEGEKAEDDMERSRAVSSSPSCGGSCC